MHGHVKKKEVRAYLFFHRATDLRESKYTLSVELHLTLYRPAVSLLNLKTHDSTVRKRLNKYGFAESFFSLTC